MFIRWDKPFYPMGQTFYCGKHVCVTLGPKILSSFFFVGAGWGGGGVGYRAINLFKIGARMGRRMVITGECADFEKVDCGKHVCVALGPKIFGSDAFSG